MTLVDYKVYRQEVLNFLQSCTIKFDLFAENALIELEKNGIDINDVVDKYNKKRVSVPTEEYKDNLTYKDVKKGYYVKVVSTGKLYKVVNVSIAEVEFEEYTKEDKDDIFKKISVDDINPYYLNLAGQYSILDNTKDNFDEDIVLRGENGSDNRIYVNVIETRENNVLLTRELLNKYPMTASVYKIGNPEYDQLLKKYPKKQGLIKSICYPVESYDVAKNSRDLTLLKYDASFLEADERDGLILALKNFLEYIYNRWFVYDFKFEPAYSITFMGMIWSILPSVLLTERIKNLRTSQVHSMHIWEYLDSKGLGEYKPILNREQSVFLYRNIDYLLQNKGKKTNIEILAENLLKGLHIHLVGKTILQETSTNYEDCITNPEFLSDAVVQRGSTEQIDEDSKQDMRQILYRMYLEGYYPDYSIDNSIEMNEKFGLTEFNNLPTRLLEFEKNILDNKYISYFTEFMVDSLVYHWTKGIPSFHISFVDTVSLTTLDLTVGEVLALLHYIHFKESGQTPINIPTFYTSRLAYPLVQPEKLPENYYFEDLTNKITNKTNISCFKYKLRGFINTEQILKDIPFDIITTNSQTEYMTKLANHFSALLKHTRQVRESAHTRYQEAMRYYYEHLVLHDVLVYNKYNSDKDIDTTFISGEQFTNFDSPHKCIPKRINIKLTNYDTYSDWIKNTENLEYVLDMYDKTDNPKEYYKQFCDTLWMKLFPIEEMPIFDEFTGADKDNSEIYRGLKKLFIQLCSYRLYFLETDRTPLNYIVSPYQSLYTLEGSEESDLIVPFGTEVNTHIVEEFNSKFTNRIIPDLYINTDESFEYNFTTINLPTDEFYHVFIVYSNEVYPIINEQIIYDTHDWLTPVYIYDNYRILFTAYMDSEGSAYMPIDNNDYYIKPLYDRSGYLIALKRSAIETITENYPDIFTSLKHFKITISYDNNDIINTRIIDDQFTEKDMSIIKIESGEEDFTKFKDTSFTNVVPGPKFVEISDHVVDKHTTDLPCGTIGAELSPIEF